MSTELDTELNVEETTEVASSIDLDEIVEVENPTADFNVPAPPPRAGTYTVRWKLNDSKNGGGIEPKNSAKVGNFLNVFLLGAIVAPDQPHDGYLLSDYMHTIVNRQKGTSEVHHFLNCIGTPLDRSTSLRGIMDKLREELSVEPNSRAIIEWKATYIGADGKYVDYKRHMKEFPEDSTSLSGYRNWVESPIDGERIYARAYVVQHLLPNS